MKGLLFLIFVGVIAVLALAFTFGRVVFPGEMGVRQITIGPYQGFTTKALGPGYHWSVPFYSRIHVLPRTIGIIDFLSKLESKGLPDGAVEVQTTDGSSVYVDVTVLYRFYDQPTDKNGGPADAITRLGGKQGAVERIRTATINEIKKSLGRLSTSQFYDPYKREEQVKNAELEMNARLEPYGIKIEDILLRRYAYAEKRIDDAIGQKNLQVQEERLNAAKSRFSEAFAKIESAAAEGDKLIRNLEVDGESDALVTRSEGDLYEAQKRADGDLLVAKSKAEIERQRADTLGAPGSDIYVARELAALLSSLRGGVIGKLDPYNLDEWMKRFGVAPAQEGGR